MKEQEAKDAAICQLCGEPMPEGDELFNNYHSYSGECQKPVKSVHDESCNAEIADLRDENQRLRTALELARRDIDDAILNSLTTAKEIISAALGGE